MIFLVSVVVVPNRKKPLKRRKINMSMLGNLFSATGEKTKKSVPSTRSERQELANSAKPLALTPEMILNKPLAEKITFENIANVIMRVRTNELIGKGKLTKDEYLADSLYALVRHHDPETKLTYELIEKAISFVKRNPIMGSGKWTKEEHLSEYLYATIRLSNSASNSSSSNGNASSEQAASVSEPA
jgi:hypothetical protein